MSTFEKQTVREIAIHNPAAVRVFDTFGIDYCCGGKRPLDEACKKAEVPFDTVLRALQALEPVSAVPEERDWAAAALAELAAHIVNRHHAYVREETPRIERLLQKVVGAHGKKHPEVAEIQQTFGALSGELSVHMLKEERVLFPFIGQLEAAVQSGGDAPSGCFASVEMPISRMLADHDDAGALLTKMRALSDDYRVPDAACPTYRGLYAALEAFERDLHHHVHLENNILFPRAVAIERTLEGTAHVLR
jgi:regulator of cell morphogenesis and NO signaling